MKATSKMIRYNSSSSQSKSNSSLNSQSKNSVEYVPKGILRKTEKRYTSLESDTASAVTLTDNDTYKRQNNSPVPKRSKTRRVHDEERKTSSQAITLNENQETPIRKTPSCILPKVCGAQFPLLDKNNNDVMNSRDFNNNEFPENKFPSNGEEEDITAANESKPASKDDTLDDPALVSRLQEGAHSATLEINSGNGGENDKVHTSSSTQPTVKKDSSPQRANEKKLKRKGILALPVKTNLLLLPLIQNVL